MDEVELGASEEAEEKKRDRNVDNPAMSELSEDAPSYFEEGSVYWLGTDKKLFTNFLKLLTMYVALFIFVIPGSIAVLFGDQAGEEIGGAIEATGLATSYYYGDYSLDDYVINPVQKIVKYSEDDEVWWAAAANNEAGKYSGLLCIFAGFFVLANSAGNLCPAMKHIVDYDNYPSSSFVGGKKLCILSAFVNFIFCIVASVVVWARDEVDAFWMLITVPTFHVIWAMVALFGGNATNYFHLHFQAAFAFEFTIAIFTVLLCFSQSVKGWGAGTIANYAMFIVIISSLDENLQSLIDLFCVTFAACCGDKGSLFSEKQNPQAEATVIDGGVPIPRLGIPI